MKKTKKILAIAVILMLILGSLTFVKAETDKLVISDGVKEGNKVTFKIDLPKDTALKGDVDLNGKIESADIELINKYLLSSTQFPLTEIQLKAADAHIDGTIDSLDQMEVINYVENIVDYKPVTLKGTLADSSKYELVKDSSGNYSIVVTLPENVTGGTIGIIVNEGTFMYALNSGNEETSSKLLDIATSEKSITISDGVKEGNKITFKINLPEDTALTGDVNLNGKLDEDDCTLIDNIC